MVLLHELENVRKLITVVLWEVLVLFVSCLELLRVRTFWCSLAYLCDETTADDACSCEFLSMIAAEYGGGSADVLGFVSDLFFLPAANGILFILYLIIFL